MALVVFLALAVYVAGGKFMSMAGTLATLSTLRPGYLAPILLLALAYYVLKALRWHYYLGVAQVRVPLRRSLAAYLAGQWFTFTPAGELVRAYLLGAGTRFSLVAPTVVMQALVDFASLALVATAVVAFYPSLAPLVLPVTLPLLLVLGVLAVRPLRRVVTHGRLTRRLVSEQRRAAFAGADLLLGPAPVAVGLLLGIPTVLSGGVGLYLAGVAVGVPGWGALSATGVYSIIQLLGGISPLPQGLGVTEGSGTLLLGYLGVDPPVALAAVLLFRTTVLGFSAALGLVAFVALRLIVPDLKHASAGEARRAHAAQAGAVSPVGSPV